MEKKMVQRDYFNAMIEVLADAGRDDLVEFCEGRIAALDKKAASAKANKKVVEANKELQNEVSAVMDAGEQYTVSEVMAKSEVLGKLSNQKVSAVMRSMEKDGLLMRDASGKKTLWSVAA